MTRTRWTTTLQSALTGSITAFAIVCVLAYLFVEVVYVLRLPLIADEFDGAYDVYQLRNRLPYVDFKPYKTVLGYYLQLPPLLLAKTVWHGLIDTKLWLAALNAACTLGSALFVARKFSIRAVALALPLWVFMSDWLERSSELRVDTLTAWAGLFSLLALLSLRPALAGFLAGLSFLISQKGAYFVVASAAGLVAVALITATGRPRLHAIGRFGAACALTIAAYVAYWSVVSSLHATTAATFLSHRAIAFDDIYPHIRRYWWQTLRRNPAYYALVVAGVVWLGARVFTRREVQEQSDPEHARDTLLFGYAALFATCVIWHKQPWPYFFVLLVPVSFVMHVWLFDNAWRAYQRGRRGRAQRALLVLTLIGIIVAGIGAPLARMRTLLRYSSAYQHQMLTIAESVLAPDDYYIAAADLLYNRTQASSTLRRVALARRRELAARPDKWSKVILADLRQHPPKLLIRNERFDAFPKGVAKYLRANYAPFWGGIELYAPEIPKGIGTLTLLFGGEYEWHGARHRRVRIGDTIVKNGERITLARGPVEIESKRGGRLAWQPNDNVRNGLKKRFRRRRGFYSDSYGR